MGPIEYAWKDIKPSIENLRDDEFRKDYNIYYVLKQYYDLGVL